jgi:hypothetical protein
VGRAVPRVLRAALTEARARGRVRPRTDLDRESLDRESLEKLHGRAHRGRFIANSVRCEMVTDLG